MKVVLLFIFLIANLFLYGQTKPGGLKPALTALQVENLDSSIHFYISYLGFNLTERKSFPEYNLEIAFISNNGYELELVKNEKTLKRNNILKEKVASDITGFAKLAFTVSNIRQLYDHLKSQNINVIIPLMESNRDRNKLFFIITDKEKNWLQFLGDK